MDRVFIRVEEGMLAGRFGEAWDEYRRLTRRWI
jgi:protein-S-isoprenylcysteine O-methyltransferase Ste14